jgi:chaperonin cofactor prefoldin
MMNKNLHDQDAEEEYKLQEPERESGAHFSESNNSSETASDILEKTKRQHIFLVLILILASLGAYKVVNRLMQGASFKPKMAEKLIKPALPIVSAAVQAHNVIANRFTHLEQQQHDLKSDFQAFDSELSDIKSTLAELNMRFAQINDQVQTLHTQQEAFLQKQQQAKSKIIARKKAAPKPIYFVRAIIPGRVWLTMQDGSTLTLGRGDKLPGYGFISAIDPAQGTITLSSGAVIGYNPDDR